MTGATITVRVTATLLDDEHTVVEIATSPPCTPTGAVAELLADALAAVVERMAGDPR